MEGTDISLRALSLINGRTGRPASDMTSYLYQYQALDTTRQQIRLIRLHRDPFRDLFAANRSSRGIHCTIESFDIDTAPQYIALSYTWGATVPTQNVCVNGKDFVVRENLFDFLAAFCNDEANTYHLWIDQLCIDQSSTLERNHQVQLMSEIYRRCRYVITWLDVSSSIIAQAFLKDPNPASARALLRNRYFTRVWVVQEIILAPEVRILCGRIWIPWEFLANIVSDVSYHGNDSLSPTYWLFHKQTDPHFLLAAVETYAKMDCQDPRDKVYGVLGLVFEYQRPEVDYNKMLEEIYVDVVKVASKSHWEIHGYHSRYPHFTTAMSLIYDDFALDLGFIIEPLGFFSKIGNIELRRIEQQGCYPVPAMGFEKANPIAGTLDRCWYEDEGLRYYASFVPYIPSVKPKAAKSDLLELLYRQRK